MLFVIVELNEHKSVHYDRKTNLIVKITNNIIRQIDVKTL